MELQQPGETGIAWTVLHPVHLCIIVATATYTGAKLAEKTFRFALAVTLTILAGVMVTTKEANDLKTII